MLGGINSAGHTSQIGQLMKNVEALNNLHKEMRSESFDLANKMVKINVGQTVDQVQTANKVDVLA